MNNIDTLKQAELLYQADRASKIAEVQPTPDYIFERYRKAALWRYLTKEFVFKKLIDAEPQHIFDFGCGDGEITTQMAKLGCSITAMDLSPELVTLAKRRAELDGVKNQVNFLVGDILESPLPACTFDAVVCNAVLHHVDLYKVVPVLVNSLKPGGIAIFVEPIAYSPWLQKFRELLPVKRDASPDERQLNAEDIKFCAEQISGTRIVYFNFLGRLQRFIPNVNKIDKGHKFAKAALICLLAIDRLILTLFPFLNQFCGNLVVVGYKPSN